MYKRLIALLLVIATMLSLMGSAAPAVIGEAAVSESAGEEMTVPAVQAESAYDYSADVGKYVVLNEGFDEFLVADGTDISEDAAMGFLRTELLNGTMMRITDWYIREETSSLWYRVEFYSGGLTEEAAAYWPESPWIMQCYMDTEDEENTLNFVPVCDICGKPDCDKTHEQCPDCGEYDCDKTHIYCPVCGGVDCAVTHVYCSACGKYDCGEVHEDIYTPNTAPVIPDYTLPEGADFAVVNGEGTEIGEAGVVLPAGKQMSLSAWCREEGVSYQWQVRYDHENDLWVDIRGQEGQGILFSAAMLENVADESGVAYLRFVAAAGEEHFDSPAIPVTLMGIGSAAASSSDSEAVAVDLPEAQAEDVKERHTISIRYVYENGSMAAGTWSATLAEGDEYNHTFTMPTVAGYKPTGTSDDIFIVDENAGTITVNVGTDSLTEDRTLVITYVPASVKVTIRHYKQRVDGTGYEEPIEEVTYEYITDELVDGTPQNRPLDSTEKTVLHNSYDGFYNLRYTMTEAAAANGTTKIEIYYDRYYYLVNFDLGGGYGVEPIYDRFGTDIGNIPTPTRPGYVFAGWSLDGQTAITLPAAIPAKNTTYKALWTPGDAVDYTIVYWKENADDNNYSYWTQRTATAIPGTVVSGSNSVAPYVGDEQYFTYNDALTDKKVVIEGDGSTIINVYYNRNYYTLVFYYDGECNIEEHTHGVNCEKNLICGDNGHTHTAECKRTLVCTETVHEHDEDCETKCGLPIHTQHTDACLQCTKELHAAHTVNDGCYVLNCNHSTHTLACYGNPASRNAPNNNYLQAIRNMGNGEPQSGYVYRTRQGNSGTYTNYLYYNGNWYNADNVTIGPNYIDSGSYTTGSFIYRTTYNAYKYEAICTHTHSIDNGCYDLICTKPIHEAHTEADGCYTDVIHAQHTDACYDHASHSHTDVCYTYQCGETPHEHTDACYSQCVLYEHTHGSSCRYSNNNDYEIFRVITAKYEANIGDEWPTADDIDGFAYWTGGGANQSSKVMTMTSDYCNESGIKLQANYNSTKYTLNYWFEYFDQTVTPDGITYKERNGIIYKLSEEYSQTAYYGNTSSWSYKSISGMTGAASSAAKEAGNVFNLYYTRNRVSLHFHNVKEVVKTQSDIMYGQPLENYTDSSGDLLSAFVPAYPDTLEPGVYEFQGWYTTPDCIPGTQVDWTDLTMPNNDLTLYAKWAPVTRTIRFYLDKEDMLDGNTIPEKLGNADGTDPYSVKFADKTVPNNTLLGDKYHPGVAETGGADHEYKDVTFVGWFYMDGDEEKAFAPETMLVTQDLELYAKWTSDKIIDVNVYYVLGDANGNKLDADGNITTDPTQYVHVAAPTQTSGLYLSTKTFEAKTEAQLYDGYQSGYFPNTASTSLIIEDFEEGQDNPNTFYFVYTEMANVPYTVRYIVDFGNGVKKPLKQTADGGYTVPDAADVEGQYTEYKKYVGDNKASVVTENFIVVSGYMPDAYQKRMTLTSDGSENVITFVYSVNEVEAMYQVIHYIQSADGTGWVEYQNSAGIVGKIGERQEVSPMSINGYTFNAAITDANNSAPVEPFGSEVADHLTAILPAAGMVMKLYYVRPTELSIGKYVNVEEEGTGTPEVSAFAFTVKFPEGVADGTAYKYTVTGVTDEQTVTVNDGKTTITLKNGQTATFKGLPLGSYEVSEADYSGQGYSTSYTVNSDPAVEGREVKDLALQYGIPVNVQFINKFPVGSLEITKTVTKEWNETAWDGDTFTFVVERTHVKSGEERALAENTEYVYWLDDNIAEKQTAKVGNKQLVVRIPFTEEEKATLEQTGSVTRTLTIKDLIAGTYTVAEEGNTNTAYKYTTTTNAGSGTVQNGVSVPIETGTAEAGFTNILKRPVEDMTLEKKLVKAEGYVGDLPVGQRFGFTVKLLEAPPAGGKQITLKYNNAFIDTEGKFTGEALERTVSMNSDGEFVIEIQSGQTVTMCDLPVGKYRITEASVPQYANAFKVGDVASNQKDDDGNMFTELTLSDGNPAAVVCTNEYPVDTSELVVKKVVTRESMNDTVPEGAAFPVTVKFAESANQDGRELTIYVTDANGNEHTETKTVTNHSVTVSLQNGGSVRFEKLPVCDYTVTEEDNKDFTASYKVYVTEEGVAADETAQPNNSYEGRVYNGELAAGYRDTVVFTNQYKAQTADLTITKSGWNVIDENQSFIFTVTDSHGFAMDVVIKGNGSVTIKDLPIDTYTVTEQTGWSWRYAPKENGKQITLKANQDNVLTFENERALTKWLNGGAYAKNLFDGSVETN